MLSDVSKDCVANTGIVKVGMSGRRFEGAMVGRGRTEKGMILCDRSTVKAREVKIFCTRFVKKREWARDGEKTGAVSMCVGHKEKEIFRARR